MYSANIQRLLNAEPIRPPSRNDRSKRPQSTTSIRSLASLSRFPSFKDTFYVSSSNISSKTQTQKIADLKDEFDIGDEEPTSMKVPIANLEFLDKENIDTRVETSQDEVARVSTNPGSKFSKKPSFTRSSIDENKTPLAESFCNQSLHGTSTGKHTDVRIISFGPKHYSQHFHTNSTESYERGNAPTPVNNHEDFYHQAKFKNSVEIYTFESEEPTKIHHHYNSVESQGPILIQSVLKDCDDNYQQVTNSQSPKSPEKTTSAVEVTKPSTPVVHHRGRSQAASIEEFAASKHQRFTSDTNFGNILNLKSKSNSRNR